MTQELFDNGQESCSNPWNYEQKRTSWSYFWCIPYTPRCNHRLLTKGGYFSNRLLLTKVQSANQGNSAAPYTNIITTNKGNISNKGTTWLHIYSSIFFLWFITVMSFYRDKLKKISFWTIDSTRKESAFIVCLLNLCEPNFQITLAAKRPWNKS